LGDQILIENADIFLSGAALSNICINKDYWISLDRDSKNSRGILEKELNTCTRTKLKLNKDIWSTEIKNVNQFIEICKSHSAYHPLTKREYIAICHLEDRRFNEDVLNKDELNILRKLKNDINNVYGLHNFKIEDIELKFYEYGNVTITGRLKIRDKKLSKEDYKKLSDFAHAYFGPSIKETACRLINIYIEIMKRMHVDETIDYYLIKVPSEIEIKEIEKHALNFAIRYHFIYNSSLRSNSNFMDYFRDILTGEWELNLKNVIYLKDASIYFGWTHSLIVLDNLLENTSEVLYHKYKLPLEVVSANWATLDLLSKGLDRARAKFIQDIDRVEKSNPRKNNYVRLANEIREFTLKIERIIESFDSYTVSNNPMHYKLIDLQQEVWLEDKSIEKVRKKLDLVCRIVDELSIRQKSFEGERLNRVLMTITFLTVVSVPKVIYDLIFGSMKELIFNLGIFFVLVLLIVIIYCIRFSIKDKRIQNK
jgi:hypothetical protein